MADPDRDKALELFLRARHNRGGSAGAIEPLVAIFLSDIHDFAAELESQLPENYELSDLLGAGVAGLLELVEDSTFAPDSVDEFIVTALHHIEVAIREQHEKIVSGPTEFPDSPSTDGTDD